MNYELAKSLKDAGFPEPVKSFAKSEIWIRNKKDNIWWPGDKEPLLRFKRHGLDKPYKWGWFSSQKDWDWENYVYIPTLSELLEACGEEFGQLRSPKDNRDDYMEEKSKGFLWTAQSSLIEDGRFIENGSTPEEAVARLWLELNKK